MNSHVSWKSDRYMYITFSAVLLCGSNISIGISISNVVLNCQIFLKIQTMDSFYFVSIMETFEAIRNSENAWAGKDNDDMNCGSSRCRIRID